MDYLKQYDNLIIKRGKRVKPEVYSERHHIIPRCMGGLNTTENLVYLTAREHFVAHLLLYKAYGFSSLAHSLQRMTGDSSGAIRVINSRYFEMARKLFVLHHPMKNPEAVAKMVANHHYTKAAYLAKLRESHNKPELVEFRRKFTTENNPMANPDAVSKMRASLMISDKTGKQYKVYKPDGSIVIIRNLRRFANESNIPERSLFRSIVNGKPNRRGYKVEEYKQ